MLDPGGNRRSTASSGWRNSGFRGTWCCSFAAAPQSPDCRPSSRNPYKQPATATVGAPKVPSVANSLHSSPSPSSKLGLGIIDPRRILSPGRVSPIDSDVPLVQLPEKASSFVAIEEQEIPYPPLPGGDLPSSAAEADSGGRDREKSLDLRLKVTGRDGRRLVMEMNSGVLCANSSYFAGMVLRSRPKASDALKDCWEIEVEGVENLDVFRETIEMMFDRDEMNWLMKAGVSRAIDVLEVRMLLLVVTFKFRSI